MESGCWNGDSEKQVANLHGLITGDRGGLSETDPIEESAVGALVVFNPALIRRQC